SFLSAMVINPLIALAGNFYNYSETIIETKKQNLNLEVDKDIKKDIFEKNEEFKSEIGVPLQRKYFTENLSIDLNLQFGLKTVDWPIANQHRHSKIDLKSIINFNDSSNNSSIFLNNDGIEETSNNHEFEIGNIVVGYGGFSKDKNLRLDFSNSILHKQKSIEEGNNDVGKKITVETTLNSKYRLIGDTKYKNNDKIAYAATANFMYGSDHYLVSNEYKINDKDKEEIIFNPNITGGKINFKDGGSIVSQKIDRNIVKYSSEDNLKIFNFVFENNYLPSIENSYGVVNEKYITQNEKGKLIKFGENFSYLKTIGYLNRELEKLIKNNENIENHNINFLANEIIEDLKIGNFKNAETALVALKEINKKQWTSDNSELLNLLENFKYDEIGYSNIINKDLNELVNILVNEKLMKEKIKFEKNIVNIVGSFYEDIITWLSVNEIQMKLNGKSLTIFKNGEIKNNQKEIDIFTNADKTLTKQFFVSEIVIKQPEVYNKNLFCDDVKLNKDTNTNDTNNKVIKKFLTDIDYKVAYEKEFVEKKFDNLNKKMGRTIPVDVLPNNLTEYLFINDINAGDDNAGDGNVYFKEISIETDVRDWIVRNIKADNQIRTINNTFLTNRGWIDSNKVILDFNNKDLFALLDLDDEFELINKNDENYSQDLKDFGEKFNNELSNKNFNDDDGVFYFLATIADWNGEKTI
ncbi:MAG: hypothetical protein ACRCUM_00670, partial [Mycoplasmoidaceae bacterium]